MMKRRHAYAAVLVAGLLTALGSVVSVADTSTTTTQPPTVEPTPTLTPMSITPRSGRPGQTVALTLNGTCLYGVELSTTVLTMVGQAQTEYPYTEAHVSARVNSDAQPGTHDVLASCYNGHPPTARLFATRFTVIKNPTPAGHQVKQVPQGAAQTGGGGTAPRG